MFGFLQAPSNPCCGQTPSLWRGHFCGLATRLHQDFGAWARMLVNRDSTFLALSAAGSGDQARIATCCNPLSPPKPIYDQGPNVSYAADIALCGLSMKLRDDRDDEGWGRRLLSRAGLASVSGAVDKAVARLNGLGFPSHEVLQTISAQGRLEAERPDALRAAGPTSEAYGRIFGFAGSMNSSSGTESNLEKIGHSLGRLIYWDDAWRDWRKDQRKGRFNPLQVTSADELRTLIENEFVRLEAEVEQLRESPSRNVLQQVVTQTRPRLPMEGETPEEEKKRKEREKELRRKRRREQGDDCYNRCECCSCYDCTGCLTCGGRTATGSKGACDACFDCGPGDRGCIDCNPCDGCSCC